MSKFKKLTELDKASLKVSRDLKRDEAYLAMGNEYYKKKEQGYTDAQIAQAWGITPAAFYKRKRNWEPLFHD